MNTLAQRYNCGFIPKDLIIQVAAAYIDKKRNEGLERLMLGNSSRLYKFKGLVCGYLFNINVFMKFLNHQQSVFEIFNDNQT